MKTKNQKDLGNFRHIKLTLKVRILETADDQKQFEAVCFKKKNSESTNLRIVDHRDPSQPWTLQPKWPWQKVLQKFMKFMKERKSSSYLLTVTAPMPNAKTSVMEVTVMATPACFIVSPIWVVFSWNL